MNYVVYFDEEYHGSWISRNDTYAIVDFFQKKGFKILDAKQLQIWMELVPSPDEVSQTYVVIFSMDVMPNTIYSPNEPRKSHIWNFLRKGGKAVWFGDVPFYLIGEPLKKRNKLAEYGFRPLNQILGVVSLGDLTLRKVHITEHGASAGLVNSWNGIRPVKITSDLTPIGISKDNKGEDQANAWEKWNFIRLFDINKNDDPSFKFSDHLEEIYQVSICPIEKIQKKGKVRKDVFIVHGHDEEAKRDIEDIVKNEGHNPKYLRDFGSGNETLVDKLKKAKDCSYVIILLTPDDLGFLRLHFEKQYNKYAIKQHFAIAEKKDLLVVKMYQDFIKDMKKSYKVRARQNVVFEYGFFKAVKKDSEIMVILKNSENYEWDLPSDTQGGFYITYQKSLKEEKEELIRQYLQSLKEG